MTIDYDALEREMEETGRRVREALAGRYAAEFRELRNMSPNDVMPDTVGEEAYEKLLIVVREASRANLAQADLKKRIVDLGEVAVAIAKQSARLAATLGL